MDVIKTFKPGDDGTKRYSEKYGQQLCAVRYRRSPCKKTVYTTVEIIVSARDAYKRQERALPRHTPDKKWVALKIGFEETHLRNEVRRIGGRWSQSAQAWAANRRLAESANLGHRIVEGLVEQCLDVEI
ncbi:hypothetical protein [uncultured Microbulbifer sp.]|uniref:hypothetical protein n=1 Tax=uncultured Microbulbifer sp. TaxID=348147 RepID=UPI00261353CB|nr:hypothetical protein [uncultured Microbulbifer sp.]